MSRYNVVIEHDESKVHIEILNPDLEVVARTQLEGRVEIRNINSVVEGMLEAFLSGSDIKSDWNPYFMAMDSQVLTFEVGPVWPEVEDAYDQPSDSSLLFDEIAAEEEE